MEKPRLEAWRAVAFSAGGDGGREPSDICLHTKHWSGAVVTVNVVLFAANKIRVAS
jgi:hypothetical protein